MTLTTEQALAVTSEAPTTVVSAGPGSGKTRVLVARILHLVRERRVDPAEVICLVFTRAAASTIRTRLELDGVRGVTVQTFHAFAATIAVPQGYRVATETESTAAIETFYKGGMRRRDVPGVKRLGEAIFEHEATGWVEDRDARRGVGLLLTRLDRAKWIPLWDLVPKAVEQVLDRAPLKHCLVDEFQDTTRKERELVRALGENVYAVGDDRQAVYGFRLGSWAPHELVTGDVAFHGLTRTFRFGTAIAAFANRVAGRFGGGPITPADVPSEVETMGRERLLEEVARDPKNTLVLARTNRECDLIAAELGELACLAKDVRESVFERDPFATVGDVFSRVWRGGRAVVATVQASKGRESERVVLVRDLELEHEDPEENRISYVGATRARRRLAIVSLVEELCR